jgi:hypothetical protein
LERVKQLDPSINQYYRNVDFADEKLREYMKNLENEIVKKYVELEKKKIKLIEIENSITKGILKLDNF